MDETKGAFGEFQGSRRAELATLRQREFDVVVIGGGINGASTCRLLSSAGYAVLLVDKGDFGSGATSRSSRLIHCGLFYLKPEGSILTHLIHPIRFLWGLRAAQLMLECRKDLASRLPSRVRPISFSIPIFRHGAFRAWHLDAGFGMLGLLNSGPPLRYRRLSGAELHTNPYRHLLSAHDVVGMGICEEYQFVWPERICVDMALEAERTGATIRNYTKVDSLVRINGECWEIGLVDMVSSSKVTVTAKVALNLTGPWIDGVNRMAGDDLRACVTGTKGAHIMVRLPRECRGLGFASLNRAGDLFLVVPWDDHHYIGPTETPFKGDLDTVVPDDDDIASLLGETNHFFPSLQLSRSDVVHAWAGVRPVTYDQGSARGRRQCTVHDMGKEGLPNLFALSWGRLIDHRASARLLMREVQDRIAPSSSPTRTASPENPVSIDPRHAAMREYPVTLTDILFRRLRVGWDANHADLAHQIAREVAPAMGWDSQAIQEQVAAYHRLVQRLHRGAANKTEVAGSG